MLLMSMNKEELTAQIAEDFVQIKQYTDLRTQLIRDRVYRKGERHICDTWRSKNNNEWTWMVDLEKGTDAMLTFFTTINTKYGRFVFKPQVTNHGFILLAYIPHFFKRYRERMKMGTKLTTMQLIRKYFRRNGNATEEYRGKGRIEISSADGVCLGNIVSLRIRLLRTFITRDMAYGDQEERFATQEEFRKKVIEGSPIYGDEVHNELREFGLSEADLMVKWKEYFEEKQIKE